MLLEYHRFSIVLFGSVVSAQQSLNQDSVLHSGQHSPESNIHSMSFSAPKVLTLVSDSRKPKT